jgi:Carbohydrate-binding family 9
LHHATPDGFAMIVEPYPLRPARQRPELKGLWNSPAWQAAALLEIAHFRSESSDHRPLTQAKLLYDLKHIYGLFRVQDRYVRSVYRRFQDPVCRDSCVEFFVQPHGAQGYFNFEFNCGGTLLASYIVDPERTPAGFKTFTRITKEDSRRVSIYHSLPRVVDPECQDPTTWYLEFRIPFTLLEKYRGPLEIKPGTTWRANLYKCADHSSHPHWASWSPVTALNFHSPPCFGSLRFTGPEAQTIE